MKSASRPKRGVSKQKGAGQPHRNLAHRNRESRRASRPSGVAVTQVEGREFLYVGDAGNQRLVKYEILYP